MVDEFNRYNTHRLVIGDPELAKLHPGGIYRPTDLDDLLNRLRTFGIEAVLDPKDPTRILLIRRGEQPGAADTAPPSSR